MLVRKSGTEPLIRVMAEGEDEKLVRAVVRADRRARSKKWLLEPDRHAPAGHRRIGFHPAAPGIQADLKTAQAFGVYAQTAVTAVTVQDTNGRSRHVIRCRPRSCAAQIEAALDDIGADAIKIGMLGNGRDRRRRGRRAGRHRHSAGAGSGAAVHQRHAAAG